MNHETKIKKQKLKEFAQNLKKELPKSEVWFFEMIKKYPFPLIAQWNFDGKLGQSNEVFDWYIPDIINRKYKFVIEIDGSIHQKEFQKNKDRKKDKLYKSKDLEVFRITAFCEKSFKQNMFNLCNYLLNICKDPIDRDSIIFYRNQFDSDKLISSEERNEEYHYLKRGEVSKQREKTEKPKVILKKSLGRSLGKFSSSKAKL